MAPTGAERAALARARELAMNARGRVSPNPLVGAVVLVGGTTLGEGWHEGPGLPHAEVMALRDAGEAARGATVVCTLEPCSHFGRTPPCCDALIAAGVVRVVVGCLDPLERTRGQGVRVLQEAGIEVVVAEGADEEACRELNAAFFTASVRGRPHVLAKMATSLDGRIATASGESQWISGEQSRTLVHRWRADHDAVAVGIGTALADDPRLTARDLDGPVRQPARVVFDSAARLPTSAAMLAPAAPAVYVVVGPDAPAERVQALRDAGATIVAVAGTPEGRISQALTALAAHDIQSLFLEGGAGLAGSFLSAGLIDEVRWFLAPMLIGGVGAPQAIGGAGVERLVDAPRLTRADVTRVGEDVLVTGRLVALPTVAQ